MEVSIKQRLSYDIGIVYEFVSDLNNYSRWFEPLVSVQKNATTHGDKAWTIELQVLRNKFIRSKKLRMITSECNPPFSVQFVRSEIDNKKHAVWSVDLKLEMYDYETIMDIRLFYDGRFANRFVKDVLQEEIEKAKSTFVISLNEWYHSEYLPKHL